MIKALFIIYYNNGDYLDVDWFVGNAQEDKYAQAVKHLDETYEPGQFTASDITDVFTVADEMIIEVAKSYKL